MMPGQVGRRPSNPWFLALLGVMWIACGVFALVRFDASWRIVAGVFFIGIGVFFLRGALLTVMRREEQRDD